MLSVLEWSSENSVYFCFGAWHSLLFIFFACPKRNEPKEKAPSCLILRIPSAPQICREVWKLASLRHSNFFFRQLLRCSASLQREIYKPWNCRLALERWAIEKLSGPAIVVVVGFWKATNELIGISIIPILERAFVLIGQADNATRPSNGGFLIPLWGLN